jgi:hypothetical protein
MTMFRRFVTLPPRGKGSQERREPSGALGEDLHHQTRKRCELVSGKPAPSLELMTLAGATRRSAIVDIGGGASRLVDALLETGFQAVTVLDLLVFGIQNLVESYDSRILRPLNGLVFGAPDRSFLPHSVSCN